MDISNPEVSKNSSEEDAELKRIKESETYKIAMAIGCVFNEYLMVFTHHHYTFAAKTVENMRRWIDSPIGTEAMKFQLESNALKGRILSGLTDGPEDYEEMVAKRKAREVAASINGLI